jgi:N-acetylglucosaminyldiphosphoundecaprenol N-acetyl-beta-D-mannosaminyltransferase
MTQADRALPDPVHGHFTCCGVRVDALPPEAARESVLKSAFGVPRSVHLCNAYTLSLALRDASYRELLNTSDLNLADGQPVAFVGRRLGHDRLHSSVRGPGLMRDVLASGQVTGLRHYFYGSTPEVCELLTREIEQRFPAAKLVGVESAPFRALSADEEADLVRRVTSARPDIVWVGLGTPRQDEFLHAYRDRLGATLVAIGAGFDFLAGTKRMAPEWMQRRGLEWVFRLATEPRRLWRRYLVGNTLFVWGALREFVSRRR